MHRVWSSRWRRFSVALAVGAAIATSIAPTMAKGPGGIQPQPEMYAFTVHAAGGDSGTGQVLADGTIVVAWGSYTSGRITVCTMHPGDRSCATTSTLYSYKTKTATDQFSGAPQVLSTGGKDVSIVTMDCCYNPPFNGGGVIFNSTNDGKTFGKEIQAGDTPGIATATVANGQLIVANGTSASFYVQAFPVNPTTPVTAKANPNNREVGDASITNYKGGVLVASDDTNGNTLVEYAKSGSNYNKSSSYVRVASINKEDLAGVSGNALMTNPGGSLMGGDRIRFFNGTKFGTWHKVPEPKGGDDAAFTLDKVGGFVHVFFINRRNSYEVYSETTPDGIHWSPLTTYNPSAFSSDIVPILNSIGSGIVFEADGKPIRAQPIMLPQSVHVALAQAKVTIGTHTKLNGTDSVHLNNDKVTLEQLAGKAWKEFATTSESASGKFSFKIPGYSHTYRAVVNDRPGYFQFGYSNTVSLTAVHKKH